MRQFCGRLSSISNFQVKFYETFRRRRRQALLLSNTRSNSATLNDITCKPPRMHDFNNSIYPSIALHFLRKFASIVYQMSQTLNGHIQLVLEIESAPRPRPNHTIIISKHANNRPAQRCLNYFIVYCFITALTSRKIQQIINQHTRQCESSERKKIYCPWSRTGLRFFLSLLQQLALNYQHANMIIMSFV